MPKYAKMVCLVGENPLPVYLGIRQLTGKGARILLVHSSGNKGTLAQAKRLKQRVEKDTAGRTICLLRIDDPWDPSCVLSALGGLPDTWGGAALDYTGGTKVMSAMAVRALAERCAALVYLEEARGQFHIWSPRMGEPEKYPLEGLDPPLGIGDLCDLHNITPHEDPLWQPDPTPTDLQEIWRYRLADNEVLAVRSDDDGSQGGDKAAWQSYQRHRGRLCPCLALLTPQTRERWADVGQPDTPEAYKDSRARAVFEFFACHQWFEYLVREVVLCVSLSSRRIHFGTRPGDAVLPETGILSGQEFLVGDGSR
ncbi:MAG: hypothetical protein AB1505_34765, partial [Candidatus Latescibacterota bacterium]